MRQALDTPIGAPSLAALAVGCRWVVIIASDHTRPVPSRVIIPLMLAELRRGNPEAEITILIVTGCHRGATEAELRAKFGDEIYEKERIVVHDCDDTANLVNLGYLHRWGPLYKLNISPPGTVRRSSKICAPLCSEREDKMIYRAQGKLVAGCYSRLSKEDKQIGRSVSIETQIQILSRYCGKHGRL